LFVIVLCAFGNLTYSTKSWVAVRSPTLYDHLMIPRTANETEIKLAKDFYLQKLNEREDPNFKGDRFALLNYTLSKEQIQDVYHVLTKPQLREAYDSYNRFYSEELYNNMRSISLYDKYIQTFNAVFPLLPYTFIIYISMTNDDVYGRRSSIVILYSLCYFIYFLKKPNWEMGE